MTAMGLLLAGAGFLLVFSGIKGRNPISEALAAFQQSGPPGDVLKSGDSKGTPVDFAGMTTAGPQTAPQIAESLRSAPAATHEAWVRLGSDPAQAAYWAQRGIDVTKGGG